MSHGYQVNGGGRIKPRFVLDFKAIFILLFNIWTMKWVIMQMRTSMCIARYTSALACFHWVNARDFHRGGACPPVGTQADQLRTFIYILISAFKNYYFVDGHAAGYVYCITYICYIKYM